MKRRDFIQGSLAAAVSAPGAPATSDALRGGKSVLTVGNHYYEHQF